MMLSPQAARMGTVFTTLRKIGFRSQLRPTARHRISRFNKSTLASSSAQDDLYLDEDYSVVSHGVPVEVPVKVMPTAPLGTVRSQEDAWMVNVGRESDAWLHGPRSADWFTGVHPSECPGMSRDV